MVTSDQILISVQLLIVLVSAVDIGLQDICGTKLVGTCPDTISVKVVGGESSCAEKVPWNVLVELVSGPRVASSGNHIQLSQELVTWLICFDAASSYLSYSNVSTSLPLLLAYWDIFSKMLKYHNDVIILVNQASLLIASYD